MNTECTQLSIFNPLYAQFVFFEGLRRRMSNILLLKTWNQPSEKIKETSKNDNLTIGYK